MSGMVSAPTRRAGLRDVRSRRRSNSYAVALVLLAAALALVGFQQSFIAVEARATAWFVQLFTVGHAHSAGPVFFIGIGSGDVHGFEITPLCSTSVLLTPILVLGGILQLFPRYRSVDTLRALAIGAPIAIAANLARYALVTFAYQAWGPTGFDVMHHYIGSILVILCTAGAIVLMLVIATRGSLRRRKPGRHGVG